jgi:hypothetical protein
MVSKAERTIINAAGLVQGIVLVTFPAASTIFTSKSEYGLSSSQYGAMFLPQVALAIAGRPDTPMSGADADVEPSPGT